MTPDERHSLICIIEKAGILDGEAETEVDLASYAYQIWKNAITADPTLQKTIPEMPPVVFATKAHQPLTLPSPTGEGMGVRARPACWSTLRTAEGNDALAWINHAGEQRHRVAVCHPQGGGMRPGHAGPAASGGPSRPRAPRASS
ncbi:MAG: hypothetical protein KatS3mg082_2552 [Nitrospiraceae bacterium]|nr:MAG: hypothetical protein KatS3mg082_2552 [Nitrospiraceae bacterium]